MHKVLGKPLRSLFSLSGTERSRFCFTSHLRTAWIIFALFPLGAGGGGWWFGHFGTDWAFSVPGGDGAKRYEQRKDNEGWDRGWERVPSSRPTPSPSLPPYFFPHSLTSHGSPLSERLDRLDWARISYLKRNKTGKFLYFMIPMSWRQKRCVTLWSVAWRPCIAKAILSQRIFLWGYAPFVSLLLDEGLYLVVSFDKYFL